MDCLIVVNMEGANEFKTIDLLKRDTYLPNGTAFQRRQNKIMRLYEFASRLVDRKALDILLKHGLRI